jgi:orotate phosphoribosyltransferase
MTLRRLGFFYAHAILDAALQFDVIFGPAYKVRYGGREHVTKLGDEGKPTP